MTASVPDAPLHPAVTGSTAHSPRMGIHGELDFGTAAARPPAASASGRPGGDRGWTGCCTSPAPSTT